MKIVNGLYKSTTGTRRPLLSGPKRDIDFKRIVVIVKYNPNLLLPSKENVQIFMLAKISRNNAKTVAKKRSITHT